ncbi:MAG: cell division topological specificity factor MinE [Defluviitaleaceae bacterium]|nr:cell division topological specificity factor MinE [Defluviitaleaceae bacterium]
MGLFGFRKQKSGAIAKDRLQLVLFQDRMNTSPEMLEMLKSDIIKVIASYIDIDEDELDISIGGNTDTGEEGPALMANIPIKGWKRR